MAYTGYNTRFFFRFASQAGREFRIDIKKRGFTGTAEQRPVGQTPVLKRETGDKGILGTSLEIYAECKTDGEFAELYTSDAKRYLVILSSVNGNTVTPIWTGFISPELYSEPEIAPPYDVQIIATDGLGELKLHNFEPAGRVSLYTHLFNLLSFTGLNVAQSDIVLINSLHSVTPSITQSNLLASTYVDLDYLAETGANCYDALSAIMATLNLTITRYEDRWLIMRESDVEVSGNAIIGQISGGSSISLPVVQYNSMRRSRWYPVGRMETEVVPAKNAVRVTYPFQMRESMFTNPNLPDGTGWTYPTQQPNVDHYVGWVGIGGGERRPTLMNSSTRGSCSIYQDINVEAYEGKLTLRILTMLYSVLSAQTYSVFFKLRLTATGATYYLKKKDLGESYEWVTSENEVEYKEERLSGYTSTLQIPVSSFRERSFDIPGLPASGTLRIEITSKSKNFSLWYKDEDFFIGGVYLLQDAVPGYRDDIIIDNAARGSADDVDMVFGDTQYVANALKNFHNILSDSNGTPCTEWETSKYSGELLSVIAMDYAGDVALPRLKARGTINVPVNASLPVAFVNPDGIPMVIRTFDWSLCDDNINVELISVSAVEMEITSETITEITPDEAISAGGSGGTSSGGAGGTGGRSSDKFFEAIDDSGETGALAIYDLYINQVPGSDVPQIKDISKILRHLSLQVVNEGTANEQTIIVSDLTFASEKNLVSGGIGGGGDTPTGGSIATLVDVTLANLAGGDTLVYNQTSNHWENKPLLLANLGDVDGTPSNGQTLIYDATTGKWKPGNASSGSLSSVGLTMPTGFSVSGSPLTSDGTIDVSFASGYGLVTDAERNNFHSHSNKSVLDSITQHKYDHWELAYGDSHTHSNKSTLDNITSTKYNHWESAYDAMGKADYNSSNAALATQAWVGQQNFLTSSDLSGYATQLWVTGKGYITQAGVEAYLQDAGYATQTWVGQQGYITGVTVMSENTIIGTSLTTIGTVAGTPIKAKIASYLLATDFTAANIVSTLGNTAVSRATADASGNTITSSYLRKDTDDTMAGNLQIGTSGNKKVLTIRGTTTAAMVIYGNSYSTELYRDSTYLHITSSAYLSGNFVATGNVTSGNASDRRLKEDIRDISLDEAEEMLAALRPVSFRWNEMAGELSDGQLTGVSRGFIADELLAQMPGAGRKMWGDYDAIYYEQVIPYLVAGWQRQNLRLRILEGDIKVLRADNEQLRRRLRGYEL